MGQEFPFLFIAVDGGATGTRALLADRDGRHLGRGKAGPSSLTLGVAAAWQAVSQAVGAALEAGGMALPPAHRLRMVLALAGTGNLEREAAFRDHANALCPVELVNDGYAALIGAHGGAPGVVVSVGTGMVTNVLFADGTSRQLGGWGFPVDDVGSGAWLGMRALRASLHVLDGLEGAPARDSDLHQAILANCGANAAALIAWTVGANSTRFAALAPLVVSHAQAGDLTAQGLMAEAAGMVARLARAADPDSSLPLALAGSLAGPLTPYLPGKELRRLVVAQSGACEGALMLARGLAPMECRRSVAGSIGSPD